MLHIDSWPNRQLEILNTSQNKQKQLRGWSEMFGCYEMIYADGHVKVSGSWG